MGLNIAIAGLVLSGASAIDASNQRSKAVRAQRQQAAVQSRISAIKQRRELKEQVRRENVLRGQAISQAEASGTSGSSAIEGALGGLRSQLGSNVGYIGEMQEQANLFSDAGAELASAQEGMARAQTFGSIGSSLFSNSESYAAVGKSIFGATTPAVTGTGGFI